MDHPEKAAELVAKAERFGVRLDFDCDLLTATKARSGDPGGQDLVIEELVKYISEVRRFVKGRAMSVHARAYLGQRIAIKDGLNLTPSGEGVLSGVLASASGDGDLSISFTQEDWKHARNVTARAEDLLIVMDGEADGASSGQNDESKSEQRPKGFLRRMRDGL